MDFEELDRAHHAAAEPMDTVERCWSKVAAAEAHLCRSLVGVLQDTDEENTRLFAAVHARDLAAAMLTLADNLHSEKRNLWGSAERLKALMEESGKKSAAAASGEPAVLARHLAGEIIHAVSGAQAVWIAGGDRKDATEHLLRGVLECERFASAISETGAPEDNSI